MSSPLFIVDASGYLYRSYHAIGNMTNQKGESTNALFGFIRSLLKLKKDFSPEHLVAVFDGPDNTKKRKALYPEYKANRSKMPEDLRYQIQSAQKFCRLAGIPYLNIPEVEADDTMASVALWGKEQYPAIYLCTGDKDMAQMVDETVKLLNTFKENLVLGPKEVEETYGVPPDKIVDLLAITGDSSDNIPGLPGFGPKTAVSLIGSFGSLEEVLAHPEQVPGKKKQETVRQEGEKALISKKLVTVDSSIPVPEEHNHFTLTPPSDRTELKRFFLEMDFKSMLKELHLSEPEEEEKGSYTLVDDEESFEKLLQKLAKEKEICFDTETTHYLPHKAELVGIGFGVREKEAWYVPLNGKLGREKVLKGVGPLFESGTSSFYGHNVKYDLQVMARCGIAVKELCFDTLIASYLLNSHHQRHSLDALSLELFGKVKIATSDLIGKGKKAITMMEAPIEKVAEYCAEDVDYTVRLKERFEKALKERGMEKLFYQMELPLIPILAKMERAGIYLDIPCLKKMTEAIGRQLQQTEQQIFDALGEKLNLNSPKQLGTLLVEKLGVPLPKTATGFSTNAKTLEGLKQQFPVIGKILEYRTLEKLRSTYLCTLPEEVSPNDSRIHCTFNQSVAATGRLSCQDPNLQNIPIRTEVGRKIRKGFSPQKEGWSYLAADYSQIELRLLAHFSEDPNLVEAFQNGEDIHARTAAAVFHVPLEEVTKEMRYQAKAVNFGVIYGQGSFGLSQTLGISVKEAKEFIETYFKKFPHIKNYLEACKERARKEGKATTFNGRERSIPEINSANMQIRSAAERLAVNTPLQGSAADIIKLAMIKIDKALKEKNLKSFLILQIHDELIFEAPDTELKELEPVVKEIMEGIVSFRIPLTVNISIGKNWAEC